MAEPISVPIETDPDEIAAIGFDYMESIVPGWNRARGDQASQLLASCARMLAEGRETASDVPHDILRYLGRWVDNVLSIDATPAQTTATVTALDNAGYTIGDGTRFVIRTSGDSGEIFVSVGSVSIPPLSTSTAAGEVVLVAEVAGAAGSGLPIDSVVEVVESLSWISAVALTAITTGGTDAETDDEYLVRWIAVRHLAHNSPTRAADSAAMLLIEVPGVGRALALDGYDPVASTFNNEKYVTTAVADVSGEPVAGAVKTAAQALLESRRLLNSVAPVIDATYTTIDVTTAFGTHPGFDVAGVQTGVQAALAAYFSPATWGTPSDADVTSWTKKAAVRYLEVAAVIDRVEGLDEITALTLGRVLAATGVAATDIVTTPIAHGFVLNTPVIFAALAGGAPLVAGTTYYARDITATTFKLAATVGGAAINLTTDLTAGTVRSMQSVDVPLTGAAPLTRPGTFSAVGTAP
jgi:hypothetical protein